MNYDEILNKVDHTCLKQTAVWNDIKKLCDEGIDYNVASVCIPPTYVKQAKEYVKDRLKVGTVIGFPNGYNTSYIKLKEAQEMINSGADEIDMVINIGFVKDKKYKDVAEEIKSIRDISENKILKVIIETCLLDDEEKIKMCEIITECKADFIKTSTGFSTGGAEVKDIILFKDHIGKDVKIKAAGGISSLEQADEFLKLGVERLGSSRIISLIKNIK